MLKCNVMLFAAGLGTRLRPHTEIHPKPVLPLLGYPLGYYLFPYLEKIKISNFIVNTFHLPLQIHQLYVGCETVLQLDHKIQFSDETNFIKGSGGGLKQAEALFKNNNENILLCNADEILMTPEDQFLSQALEEHQKTSAFATLIVMKHPLAGTKFGAIWSDDAGRVIGFGKEAPNPQAVPWHFVGLQIFAPGIFEKIKAGVESNIFYDILTHHLTDQLVQIFPIQADWYETGNVVDYAEAKKEISEKLKTQIHYQRHFQQLSKLPRSQISDLA